MDAKAISPRAAATDTTPATAPPSTNNSNNSHGTSNNHDDNDNRNGNHGSSSKKRPMRSTNSCVGKATNLSSAIGDNNDEGRSLEATKTVPGNGHGHGHEPSQGLSPSPTKTPTTALPFSLQRWQKGECRPVMGVSLPRYELQGGGRTNKRPRSLLYLPPYYDDDEQHRVGRLKPAEDDEQQCLQQQQHEPRDVLKQDKQEQQKIEQEELKKIEQEEQQKIEQEEQQKKRKLGGCCYMSHFAGMPIPPKVLGVCSECGIGEVPESGNSNNINNDDEDNGGSAGGGAATGGYNGNVLVLCDGPGCDREFHLKCCRPPLQEVPEEEEYFCFDCHPNGGHAVTLLEQYLDETERDREAHNQECEDHCFNININTYRYTAAAAIQNSNNKSNNEVQHVHHHGIVHNNNSNNDNYNPDSDNLLARALSGGTTTAKISTAALLNNTTSPPPRQISATTTFVAATRRRQRRTSQSSEGKTTTTPITSNKNKNGNNPETNEPQHRRKSIGSYNNNNNKDNNNSSNKHKQYKTFVDQLIYKDLEENQPEWLSQLENGICSDVRGKGPPRSELEIFHRSKGRRKRSSRYVVGTSNISSNNSSSSSNSSGREVLPGDGDTNDHHDKVNDVGGDDGDENDNHHNHHHDHSLVGCVIRLYCTKTNSYHTGRILKIRQGTTTDYSYDCNDPYAHTYAATATYVDDDENDTECLVRFPGGRDHRKKSVTRWIRLEEHSLAVAWPDLVWGKFDYQSVMMDNSSGEGNNNSKGKKRRKPSQQSSQEKHRWMPAKLWMRSSRELVMVMKLLEESSGQISYRSFRDFSSSSITTTGQITPIPRPSSPPSSLLLSKEPPTKSNSSTTKTKITDGDAVIKSSTDPTVTATNTATTTTKKSRADTIDTSSPIFVNTAKQCLQQDWILAECIGRGIYDLIHVPTQMKVYGGSTTTTSTHTLNATNNDNDNAKSTTTTSNNNNNKKSFKRRTSKNKKTGGDFYSSPRDNQIMSALVRAEHGEQDRIRRWNNLPLKNVWHYKALTCLDESALGPLHCDNIDVNVADCEIIVTTSDSEDDEDDYTSGHQKMSILIEPSPLVRTGLDRTYIMDRLTTQLDIIQEGQSRSNSTTITANNISIRTTKDLAMSLSCDLVCNDSITSCIQHQTRMARLRQKKKYEEEWKGTESDLGLESSSEAGEEPTSAASTSFIGETPNCKLETIVDHASIENTDSEEAAATTTATNSENAKHTNSENTIGDTMAANKLSPPMKSPTSSTRIATISDTQENATLVNISLSLTKAVKITAEKLEEVPDSGSVAVGDTAEGNKLSSLLKSPTLTGIATKSHSEPTLGDTMLVPVSLPLTKAENITAEIMEKVPDSGKATAGGTMEANKSSLLLKSPTSPTEIATKSNIGPTQVDAMIVPVSLHLTKRVKTSAEIMEEVPDFGKIIDGDTIEANKLSPLLKLPTPSARIATNSDIGPTQEDTMIVPVSLSLTKAVKTTAKILEEIPDSRKVNVGDTIEANNLSPLLKYSTPPALQTGIATNSDIGPTQEETMFVPGSLSLTKTVITTAEIMVEVPDSRKVIVGDTIEANASSPMLKSPTSSTGIATKSNIGTTEEDTTLVTSSLCLIEAVKTTAEKVEELPNSMKVIEGDTIEANKLSPLLKAPTPSTGIETNSNIGPMQGDTKLMPGSLSLTKAMKITAEIMVEVPDSRKVIVGDTIEANKLSTVLESPTPSTLQTGIATKSKIEPTQEDTILVPVSLHLTKSVKTTAEIMEEVPDSRKVIVGNTLEANKLPPLLKSPTTST